MKRFTVQIKLKSGATLTRYFDTPRDAYYKDYLTREEAEYWSLPWWIRIFHKNPKNTKN